MYCLTRNDMVFGEIVVPARTKCIVVNEVRTDTVDAPGVYVKMVVQNEDAGLSVLKNKNKIIKFNRNVNKASLSGIVINTNTTAVYMDAGNNLYEYTGVHYWQLEKIFGENNIPESILIQKSNYESTDTKFLVDHIRYGMRAASLCSVVDYLEDEFSSWVEENCDLMAITEEDIENGDAFDGAEPGDTMLSDKGLSQFYEKQLEYQKKLEIIGFTYDFKGGLFWD